MKYIVLVTVALILLTKSTEADDVTPNPLCPYPSDDFTRFPYNGDCSKYWECYKGQRYPMSCPGNLQFNAEESVCDFPETANCDPANTVTYPTFTPGPSTTTTPGTGPTQPTPDPLCPYPSNELTYFPYPTNCSLYYECFQGIKYLMSCPSGLVFNLEKYYCDFPENVDCSRTSTTVQTTTPADTTQPISTSPTTPSNETTTSGPSTTSAPSTTSGPSTTPGPNICSGVADGTFLADPDDCSKFYECVYNKPIEGTCPLDLLWNEAKKTCDYAENVVCETNE